MSQRIERMVDGASSRQGDGADVPQYSLRRTLVMWAAATAPMSVLGWVVAPWASRWSHSPVPLADALLVGFTAGLGWQVLLALGVVRAERGSLAWPAVRDALRLGAPRDPRSGRVGGRVWWWVVAFVVLSAAIEALPLDPGGPLPRDLPKALQHGALDRYFAGNWVAFALLVVNALLAPVAEELFFRGVLLPRTRALFGRADVVANGLLFAAYHLHQPWSMPAAFVDGALTQAWPARRLRSTWPGIVTHTAPSFLIIGVVLALVLRPA